MKSITNPFADDAIKAYEKDMEGKAPFMPIGIPNRYFGTDKDGRLLEYESIGDANPPNTLSLSYTVNVTASAHNGFSKTRTPYRMTFKPQPGFKIVGYQVEKLSVNGLVNEKGVIHANGSSLDYSFELESGPVYDRFRGWMKATVSVQQEFAK
ncbi:hypothetical protein LMG26411_04697 [Cupriavidus numazuensis]|uniref:Uncharacterized protein n=2 Tax=Cupriavidus numazuensis TaxID=221992 RepID=A0ABM8TMA2_9BURK|nr:hypothetical protein LMG26411_04697 [Cupriavidus numazuensis]